MLEIIRMYHIRTYHAEMEPIIDDVEWQNITELLEEASSPSRMLEALEACFEYHEGISFPHDTFQQNEHQLFLHELQEAIDEIVRIEGIYDNW